HIRIEAYGTVDELNAHLGLLKDYEIAPHLRDNLFRVQHELFDMGAYLACETDPGKFKLNMIEERHIRKLEDEIDQMEEELSPLKNFILPGGHLVVSQCHIARCVCRRAERNVITLNEHEEISGTVIRYLNRLSDYLFVLARKLTKDAGIREVIWATRE
ncbi:MAG: cob(I)yrinic acid a,c-diamide adenosyltransferase, partial [Cyclobacteriaceae bacterium]|nr:cob(I)yrinic acid a,c-diamide adenosyltransferase [Cyclobacteriaceae bacterium]